ncbi:hypothetical protein BH23GEM3_BH23GEM3_15770 [soil metagenome]|nr:hypothetical protein [Gemmatimonadota bacterium]
MRLLKIILAAVTLGAIYLVLRGLQQPAAGRPPAPPRPQPPEDDDAEPVLGYDGMDMDTLIPWLESADLDKATLRRIRRYEVSHHARETVLATIDDLLG